MRTLRNPSALSVAIVSLVAASSARGSINLVANGDFEDPAPAHLLIGSDYYHTPLGNSDEGTWWVYPKDPGGPWHHVQHTPGGESAMSVNGDETDDADILRVWYQDVAVTPGSTYDFEAWALATSANENGLIGYILEFRAFDGVTNFLLGTLTPSDDYVWDAFNASILASTSSIQLRIYDIAGTTFPNDFMLDDISLTLRPPSGEIPEPASLVAWGCLAALGAVGAWRAKRSCR